MEPKHAVNLLRLVNGFQISRAISVVAELGIADLLQAGSREISDLAGITGTHQRSLYRLLRALAAVGVFHEDSEGRFSLTAMGHYLRSDAIGTCAPWARLIGRDYMWQAWGAMQQSIRTGAPAFDQAHGCSVWDFRQRNPAESAIFEAAMASLTDAIAPAAVEAFDFSRYSHLVDVGGGQGTFISKVLAANPGAHGTLFDQPHVVSRAAEELGKTELEGRCRIIGGDFFEEVPEGGDAYILKSILHDWDDDECVAILNSCRRATKPDGALIVIENVLGSANDYPEHMDLTMLVVTGGVERTQEEFATLYRNAGFSLTRVLSLGSSACILEGMPISQ